MIHEDNTFGLLHKYGKTTKFILKLSNAIYVSVNGCASLLGFIELSGGLMKKVLLTFRKNIINQVLLPVIIISTIVITGYRVFIPSLENFIFNERKKHASERVNSLSNYIDGIRKNISPDKLTDQDVKNIVIRLIQPYTNGPDPFYIWIQDFDGNFVYHPYFGSYPKNIPEEAGNITKKIVEFIQTNQSGFITYKWNKPNSELYNLPKEAYVKSYPEWNWIIGTGYIRTDIQSEIITHGIRVLEFLVWILAVILSFFGIILYKNYINLHKIYNRDIALKKSEAIFKGFAKNINSGVIIFAQSTVFVNDSFCKILGITESEATNFDLFSYLPDSEKERVKILLNPADINANKEFETWITLKNGVRKNIHVSYTFDSNVNFYYYIIDDHTEKNQFISTLSTLSETIRQSPTAIIITDLKGSVEYINPAFEKITGYSEAEIIGQNPRILKSNKMSNFIYEDLWNTITSGHIWKGELMNKRKDGTFFWESTIIFPIKNKQNEIIKYSSIKTDITDSKRLENELVAARDKAQESERLKMAFLNNISHEVRTPLNAVHGFAQYLKLKFIKDEEVYGYLKIMEENCGILLKVFNDIIDYSGIESRAISLVKEDVKVYELVQKVATRYNTQLIIKDLKPLEIIVKSDLNFETMVFYTDRKRLSQIFDKLISNAVKYTNIGTITISCTLSEENVKFHISDTGVGFSEEEKYSIFNTFSHGSNLELSLHKGVGLGLNIVKLLAEQLGGNITYTSKKGLGTTFTLIFPTLELKNYSLHGKNIGEYTPGLKEKNILVVEDTEESFTYLNALLTPLNTVIRAKTGLEAVKLVESGKLEFDLVIMDLILPQIDGVTATKMIKKIIDIPVIALTAKEIKTISSNLEIFDAVLSKPIKPNELFNKALKLVKNI